jgi:hypothetical protein
MIAKKKYLATRIEGWVADLAGAGVEPLMSPSVSDGVSAEQEQPALCPSQLRWAYTCMCVLGCALAESIDIKNWDPSEVLHVPTFGTNNCGRGAVWQNSVNTEEGM